MKSIRIKIIILSLVLGLFSCDLSEEPYSSITTVSYFTNEADAVSSVSGIFHIMHDVSYTWRVAELLVHLPGMYTTTRSGARRKYGRYEIDYADLEINRFWSFHYDAINRANIAIKYIPGIDMDETKKQELIGTARFLRAWCYFDLVRMYGDVPMRTEPTETEDEAFMARSPYADIYSQVIIPDLEYAEQYMPLTDSPVKGWPTRGAAVFLLGKVYLTMGRLPLEDASKLALAKEKLQDVIDNQATYGYQLMPKYIDVFPISEDDLWQSDFSKELNDELIFVIQQLQEIDGHGTPLAFTFAPLDSPSTSVGRGGQHMSGLMPEFRDLFDSLDERRDISTVYSFPHRITGVERAWGDHNLYKQPIWGMCTHKYLDPDQNGCCNGDNDVIVYRLADAYLMLAEVENEINGPTALAYDMIDVVRARANATLIDRGASWTKETLRWEIFVERNKELSCEFHDLYDLRRMGYVEETFSFNILGVDGTYSPHMELYPIPRDEIERNPLATQNPGW
jgi:hypothetical protein